VTEKPNVRRAATALVAAAVLLLTAVAPAVALPDWRTGPTRWDNPRDLRGTPKVVDLRWAAHDGFDRVVVVLRGARPDVQTLRPDELTYDPSGKPVPLKGRHRMYLVLRPAATYTPAGEGVYEGRRLVRPRLDALRGIALTGSWEGDTSFGFTSRTAAYRMFTLTRPSRVVVDFRHPR
jgi:hypothetical protein